MAQFSLSWDAYRQNICHGLSALQQNGEFVDMTIAADGHHVKVHQMVMSLVSPYIKDLIISASCPHPVIFLNKISYTVLCAILEYIYTGEVMVDKDHLQDLIEAGRELHIKGLEDMKIELSSHPQSSQTLLAQRNEGQPLSETGYFDKPAAETKEENMAIVTRKRKAQSNQSRQSAQADLQDLSDFGDDHHTYDESIETLDDTVNDSVVFRRTTEDVKPLTDATIQFTITNQGALQMVLNRYLYYLRYTSTKTEHGNTRSWKCINFQKKKTGCPACVITKDDLVVKRGRPPSNSQLRHTLPTFDAFERYEPKGRQCILKLAVESSSVDAQNILYSFTLVAAVFNADDATVQTVQYTISSHGRIQMVLNRNLYYLKYTSRRSLKRKWLCIDNWKSNRCPATVMTQDEYVVSRYAEGLGASVQYTISNKGCLQTILNRYLYLLKYTSRGQEKRSRTWKCVDYDNKKVRCAAVIITINDAVVKRYGVHNHPFHDKQILRKARDNAIFTKINEAERSGQQKKLENRQEQPPKKAKTQGGGDTTTDAE